MYKYLVCQSRWIRASTQNGEHIIAQYTRKRLAYGEARANFYSNLEMIAKHYMYDVEDYDLDQENLEVTLSDSDAVLYHSKHFVIELFYRRG